MFGQNENFQRRQILWLSYRQLLPHIDCCQAGGERWCNRISRRTQRGQNFPTWCNSAFKSSPGPRFWRSLTYSLGEDTIQANEGPEQVFVMEEIKFQTEFRKQRSQALEKTERLKKKSRISEKKDQKAEVKRKIENSLPVVPPLDQAFHCSGCTNTHSWRGWLCIDDQKHQREWMVKERRLMVKDAFQEQAKAVNGFSKLRKQGAAKKFAFSGICLQ